MTSFVLALLPFGLLVRASEPEMTPAKCAAQRDTIRLEARKVRSDLLWIAVRDADRCAALPGLPDSERAVYFRDGARARVELGDNAGAERNLKRALELRPGDADASFELARVLRERPEEALGYADAAARSLATDRRKADAFRLAGEIRLDMEDEAGAKAALSSALELEPGDLDVLQDMVRAKRDAPQEASVYALRALRAADAAPLWFRPAAYRLCARIWLEIKDYPMALASLQRALELNPDDLLALQALRQIKKARPNEAPAQSPQESQASAPDELEALRALIETRRGEKRLQEAIELAGRFVDAVPQAPAWRQSAAYFLIGEIWLELGEAEPARHAVWNARNLEPESVEIMTLAAKVGAGEGARDDPSPAGVHTAIAKARVELEDPAGADKNLAEALKLDPNYLPALRAMAELNLDRRRPAEALAYSDRALKASSALKGLDWELSAGYQQLPWDFAAFYVLRARIQRELGDAAEAAKSLKKALELVPGDPGALNLLADMRRSGDRKGLKEALALAESVVKASEQRPPSQRAVAYQQKAQIQRELGDAAGAEESLKRVVELLPGDRQALEALAQVKLDERRPGEALAYAESLVKASETAAPGERAAAYRRKAQIQRELKDAAGAAESLKRIVELSPDDRSALDSLAELKLEERRPNEALAYAESLIKASEKAPPAERAASYRRKAQIERELGDLTGAEKSLERVVELLPGDKPALESLSRLKNDAAARVAPPRQKE